MGEYDDDLALFTTEFLPSIEKTTKGYAGWTKTSPVEYVKWVTFRDAVLRGENPEPPLLKTPTGKALVAAAEMHMSISHLVGAVTPPFPPPGPSAVPSTPTGLTAQIVPTDRVQLTWNANPGPEGVDWYELYMDGGSLASHVLTTSYTTSQLTPGPHIFRVSAVNELGEGIWTNPVSITITGSPSQAYWHCDFEDAWPGRDMAFLDSWSPAGGSTIDMNLNNSNFNFHINTTGVILPQWGNTGEFKLRSTDKLADNRYAVLLAAEGVNPGNPTPPYLWIQVPEDLYIATWFYRPSDSVGWQAPLLWEFHQRYPEINGLPLPDNIAPHAIVQRDGSFGGWYPRPGDGFVPPAGPRLGYRATLGEGSPPGNPGQGWIAKTWDICPYPENTYIKVIVRMKMANDSSGRLQVWHDSSTGINPGSFNQGTPDIDYTGPTEMWATSYGYPVGLGLYGLCGVYTGNSQPTGLVHLYTGGQGRAHTTFAGAASEFV